MHFQIQFLFHKLDVTSDLDAKIQKQIIVKAEAVQAGVASEALTPWLSRF